MRVHSLSPQQMVDLPVEVARKGQWPQIADILSTAAKSLRAYQALRPGAAAEFVAECLEDLAFPGLRGIADRAAPLFRAGEPLPQQDAEDLADLFAYIAQELTEASKRYAQHMKQSPEKAPGRVVAPVIPDPRLLHLDRRLAVAFRAYSPKPGRRRHGKPSYQLYLELETLRAYGARIGEGEQILAHRLGLNPRQLQRHRRRAEAALRAEREAVPDLPDNQPVPVAYLRARLATAAVEALKDAAKGTKPLEAVATAFGLVPPDRCGWTGARIVKRAMKACERGKEGWARIPLAVCQAEGPRQPAVWPTLEHLTKSRIAAAATGGDPATADSLLWDKGANQPDILAVLAVAEKEGLGVREILTACSTDPD